MLPSIAVIYSISLKPYLLASPPSADTGFAIKLSSATQPCCRTLPSSATPKPCHGDIAKANHAQTLFPCHHVCVSLRVWTLQIDALLAVRQTGQPRQITFQLGRYSFKQHLSRPCPILKDHRFFHLFTELPKHKCLLIRRYRH